MRKFLKDKAKASLKGRWIIIILVVVINHLLTGWNATSDIIELNIGKHYSLSFNILYILMNCFLAVGLAKFNLEFAKTDGNPKISLLFCYFKYYFKTLGLSLLSILVIMIGLFLFIVPGLILAFALSQCSYILAEDPNIGIIECMKESILVMKGRKFDYFVLGFSFIGWGILSILSLGIGFLFLAPYVNMTNTYFYLEAKNNPILQ